MTEVIERDATIAPVKRDTPAPPNPPRLLDQVRARICVLHYSRSTEKTYLHWIKAYIHFHGLRHTWASWHVMAGTPLEVLQKLGAWEDPRMVQNYAHLAPEYLAGFAGNAKPWQPDKKNAVEAA